MTWEIKNKIRQLLNSEVINYLETSERLVLKNILELNTISQIEHDNLETIFRKYAKYLRN